MVAQNRHQQPSRSAQRSWGPEESRPQSHPQPHPRAQHRSHPRQTPPGVSTGPLEELAALYGVQTGYRDTQGRWRETPRDSVLQVLRALGAALDSDHTPGDEQLAAAVLERKRELHTQVIEPVLVAWDGLFSIPQVHLSTGALGESRPYGTGKGEFSRAHKGGPVNGPGNGPVKFSLFLEQGGEECWEVPGEGAACYKGMRPQRLPYGYHRLLVEAGGLAGEARVIAAPRRCWTSRAFVGGGGREGDGRVSVDRAQAATSVAGKTGSEVSELLKTRDVTRDISDVIPSRVLPLLPLDAFQGRPWGVFAPLYALRSERDWGAGDLAELDQLRAWAAGLGGCVVSTLPLLACYLDHPFEPAPYRPVSRLFWNEFYLAVEHIPEWEGCTAARELWSAADTQALVRMLRAEPLVDYRQVMALKRRVLEKLAKSFYDGASSERRAALASYLNEHPHAQEYGAFRAEQEGYSSGDQVAAASRYHLYCQWQMEEQLAGLGSAPSVSGTEAVWGSGGSGAARAAAGPPGLDDSAAGLMLDLPIGVHPQGFDAQRWPELFVREMSVGAPPDSFFAQGQDWDFFPPHPMQMRIGGYDYFAQCLRHQMRHASHLRIDHVMSLHRLFWVPEGVSPADGVYVTYPAEELYAVVCLESHRHETVVVGEDLGTVPPGVRAAMRRHGVLRTWVFQSALRPRAAVPCPPVPKGAVASLNTHDMFPFAGFLRGDDIGARLETGQLDEKEARRERAIRRQVIERLARFLFQGTVQPTGGSQEAGRPDAIVDLAMSGDPVAQALLLQGALRYLAESAAELVIVNLEDLLLETQPQNVPGTGPERPNWRRKIARTYSTNENKLETDVAGTAPGSAHSAG